MPMTARRLGAAIKEVCPIGTARVGNGTDRTTWTYAALAEATQAQKDAADNVIATIPVDGEGVLSSRTLIERFTDAEYALLWEKRSGTGAQTHAADGNLGRLWDLTVLGDFVNMNVQATQDLKAALVSSNVLTQARADEVFAPFTGATGSRLAALYG
jgi:hypothetical protein